jgi:hypothetical protein
MTNQHPITPPLELVQQWWKSTPVQILATDPDPIQLIATRAAQWGADQELEACCEWTSKYFPYLGDFPLPKDKLRAARRPPPSLKEQAMCALIDGIARGGSDPSDIETIRRALEALPE